MSDSVIPWTAAWQAFLSFTILLSLLKVISVELVMSSNHLILCCPPFPLHYFLAIPTFLPKIDESLVVVQSLGHVNYVRLCDPVDCRLSSSNSQSLLRSCPLSQWCYLTILSSATPFSSCSQYFPIIRAFFNETTLRIRWPKYWSFSFSSSPSNEY